MQVYSIMSYVAERRGGGPHDLLRGFDSFRNCFVIVFMATMVRPKPGGVFTLPFFYDQSPRLGALAIYFSARRSRATGIPYLNFLKALIRPLVEES